MAINATFAAACPTVDADYVKDVLAPVGTNLTDAQVEQRINFSWAQTQEIVGNLSSCGGSDTYCEIAALVAAHFVAISERQTKSEKVANEWSVTYMGKDGRGLEGTTYGQAALRMDCSGILSQAGAKRTSLWVTEYYDLRNITRT